MLPDDVLLKIFDFYVNEDMCEDYKLVKERRMQEWITLVHVCRRWRNVVFYSPRRLNQRLVCTPKTPVRDTLDTWPPFPLIVRSGYWNDTSSVAPDNTIAALEHNDRVCQINLSYLSLASTELEIFTNSAAMQKPFLELTDLRLVTFRFGWEPILPDSFLGGIAPRLRLLDLRGVPFPGLPKLLLSATQLVHLSLSAVPLSGYVPPEVMATTLSTLTSLEKLCFHFLYLQPRHALQSHRPPPPPLPLTRSILPRLTKVIFKGASEYLEEILARVDAPRLEELHITFFDQIISDSDLPQLFQFIGRRPTLRAPEKGYIAFTVYAIVVKFSSQTSDFDPLIVEIPSTESEEWPLSSLAQLCTSSFPPVSTLEDLYIFEGRMDPPRWQNNVENALWQEILHSFAAVKNLYLYKESVPRIAAVLQEPVGGRATEVFPTLENIFLEEYQLSGPLHEGIEKVVAARRLTNHPVAVSHWDKDRKSKQEEEKQWRIYGL